MWHCSTLDNASIVNTRLNQLGFHPPVPLHALLEFVLAHVLVQSVNPVHELGMGCNRRWTLKLNDCSVFLSALSGDTGCVGWPIRCVSTRQVVHQSVVFPCCGHHPLTLSPLRGTTGHSSDLSVGLYQVRRISNVIRSHCPTQVSILTCQILCKNGRCVKIVSKHDMSKIVNF